MASLTIRFEGHLGSLSADSLSLVLNESLQVLRDLDHRIAEQPSRTIKWVVIGFGTQTPAIELESRVLVPRRRAPLATPDRSNEIRRRFTEGVALLQDGEQTPPYYSTDNVRSIERIVKGFHNNGMSAVSFESDHQVGLEGDTRSEAILTPAAGPKIAQLT